MICRACGGGTIEGQKFCSSCGASLGQRCGACGRENLRGDYFCGECGSALAQQQAGVSPLPNAERREVTVMFCDLVGSTALGSRIDPEAFRQILVGYHACISATVAKFEGFVRHRIGDGAMVYFGWPKGNEACAERAVRAGLAAVTRLVPMPPVDIDERHFLRGLRRSLPTAVLANIPTPLGFEAFRRTGRGHDGVQQAVGPDGVRRDRYGWAFNIASASCDANSRHRCPQ